MQRISTATAVQSKPAPSGQGTPGYFTNGNAATGLPGTVIDQDFLNGIQEAIANPIETSGQELSAYDDTLLTAAMRKLGLVATYDATFAKKVGGYPAKSIVADSTTVGAYWISTADDNLTTPGTSGAAWVTLASTFSGRFIQKFLLTSSGTYTPSATAKKILVRVIGAGGSGAGAAANPAGSNAANCGGAGACGAYVEFLLDLTVIPGPFTVNIGKGGVGSTGAGAPGGATWFGTASANLVICNGGGGGASTGSVASGQTGFANQSSGGTPVVNQTPGLTGIIALPGQNGMSPFVAAGALLPPVGPASQMGVGGGNGSTGGSSIVCQPAIGYGAASGGGASSGTGTATAGNGAQGVVEITEYT